jgi:hypothetical protein
MAIGINKHPNLGMETWSIPLIGGDDNDWRITVLSGQPSEQNLEKF